MEPLNPEEIAETSKSESVKPSARKILKFGVIGVVSIAVAAGAWIGFTELRISNSLEQAQSSLASGDLEGAEKALVELEELDPENELLESLQVDLDYSQRFASYVELLRLDDLDEALTELELASEIKPSSELENLSEDLSALMESKANFEAGLQALESGNYEEAYSKLEGVIQEDAVRYQDSLTYYDEAVDGYLASSLQEAKSKLGTNDLSAYRLASDVINEFPNAAGFSEVKSQAEQAHASQARVEAEKLVKSGFYISAFKLIDKTQSELGRTSSAVRELNNWFDPIFDNAKASALKNDMAVRTDSFTGNTSYHFKGTYRTIGNSLLAADRFMLFIAGKSNPRLVLNVMIYQDDWVFADSIQANIDGSIWTVATDSLFGDSIERDNAYGNIWEYTGRYASDSDVSYFLKARESKKTAIRFQGDQNSSDFTVTSTMKLGIERVLLAYLELGGSPSFLK